MTPISLLIPIFILSVSGRDSITRAEFLHNVLPAVNELVAPMRVSVKGYRRIRKPQPFEDLTPEFMAVASNYGKYWEVAKERRLLRRKMITHFILPPYHYQGRKWIAGMAGGGCYQKTRWSVSMSNAEAVRTNGGNGYYMSAVAMAHEVLHNLNLDDKNGSSLMDTGILSMLDYTTPALTDSDRERALRCQLYIPSKGK